MSVINHIGASTMRDAFMCDAPSGNLTLDFNISSIFQKIIDVIFNSIVVSYFVSAICQAVF